MGSLPAACSSWLIPSRCLLVRSRGHHCVLGHVRRLNDDRISGEAFEECNDVGNLVCGQFQRAGQSVKIRVLAPPSL